MKTINSKKEYVENKEIKLLIDPETKKYNGFAGKVVLYDVSMYVDTRDGTGYDDVIDKLKPLIYKLSAKYSFNGNAIEDTRHDIIIHILEGIPKYDPRKNTKLSTFIEMRVNRRLINDLRNKSRISRNATYLNVGVFNVTCGCGHSFVITLCNNSQFNCAECGKPVRDAKKKMSVNTPEINESFLDLRRMSKNYFDECNNIMRENVNIDDNVIFMNDMKNWLSEEDPRVVKIIELIYFYDYSIKAAAEKVGISGAGANMKLKELAKNNKVKELFGR